MLFADISLLDKDFTFHEHRWVGVAEGRIAYIGEAAPPDEEAAAFGEVYEGQDRLLMAGFYNAHAHAPMTLLRGYAESLPLQEWLFGRVFPFEEKISGEDCYWATLLAAAEMARFGVVGFSDMYYHSEERIRAVVQAGLKMNSCEGLLAFEDKPYRAYPHFAHNEELVARYHGSDEGRIRIDYNIHAEYTSNPQVVADVAAIAQEKGLHIHLHASETRSEHEECKSRRGGLTPLQYFASLGVLDCPTTAAHCVWAEEADIDILAEKGVTVACNPASNMKLGSGFAPIPRMLERGVAVALGTDGMASNNNHDMMQDLYLLSLVYKGDTLDPSVVTPAQALYAATRAGALAQGRTDCGYLGRGAKADLCVLDTSGPSWAPATSPLYNLVFAGHGNDVCLTMVDGKVVYRDGSWPTLDIEQAKAKTSEAAKRIIASL
ncbi:MAG: amidohydrolase [Coriobacteriaceae bacterium]|jgi:5-methylthioadenosine/S-adenosylhomocysteine deaminase|nr:amidohydrolase [Coriobacteriaceae bacterium]